MADTFSWGNTAFRMSFAIDDEARLHLSGVATQNGVRLEIPTGLPIVDVLTARNGHALASDRLVHTRIGEHLEYRSHSAETSDLGQRLRIELVDPIESLALSLVIETDDHAAAWRSHVEVTNASAMNSVVLRSVTSWATYLGTGAGEERGPRSWSLSEGTSDWLAEGRWTTTKLTEDQFPDLASGLTGHNPRGELSRVSTGTWSTGKRLPVAVVASASATWIWQIEHNGAWRWELGEDAADGYFALSGPTDVDHQWSKVLQPGETFDSVPVTVASATTFESAVGELTAFRRSSRRQHPDNDGMKVVFNDYMNTLNGDPTTAKLLPLVDAAAAVGAEVFCIDAGWYDDGGDWWDSVGEWVPSANRFPNGLGEVIDRIRQRGMIPGLWLEPEVVGVRSPMAATLPDSAFLSRNGQRLAEHGRFHLDLRSPDAVAHLDSVVDRLVHDFGVGYFKLDYNIDPGPGTDHNADSIGDGLLGHNRAHLAWLDSVLDRHPSLILENCGSGAMRMDFALLSRLQLQSTSDQQDFVKYPPIAVAAPVSMLPEQAASWAYPQPSMTLEEVALCLATGVLGRFYLSGYLNEMGADQLRLVTDAVDVVKRIRPEISRSMPFWPLGLPAWTDAWLALGLAGPTSSYLTVWSRSDEQQEVTLHLPHLAGHPLTVTTLFPLSLETWSSTWDQDTGTMRVRNTTGSPGARTFQLTPAPPES